MEAITENLIWAILFLVTPPVSMILWALADGMRSSERAFFTQLGSAIVAVFFVFFLTPIVATKTVPLFVLTYGLFIAGMLLWVVYQVFFRDDERVDSWR